MLDVLDAEGLDVSDLRGAAAALRANGTSPTLADVGGEGTLQLLSETLGSRTPAKQKLAEGLLSRQSEQGAQISGNLFRSIFRLSKFGLQNAYDAVDDLATQRASAATPKYAEAYQDLVPTSDRLKQILSNPKFRGAWEEGRRIAQTEELAGVGKGLEIPDLPATSLRDAAEQELVDLGVTGDRLGEMLSQLPNDFPDALPVRGLDYMKRGLDNIIKRGLKSGKVTDAQEMRALRALREEVLELADDASPSFGQARSIWSDATQSMEAVELGQAFARKPPPVVARELEALISKSPGLADFYRLGAAQSLYEMATGTAAKSEGADVARLFGGRLFGTQNQDAMRIRALFPDAPDVAEDFMRQVDAQARISHTSRAVGSSRTGRALQTFEEQVEGSPPRGALTPALFAYSIMRDGITRLQGSFKRDVSDDLASLFSRGIDDPAELDLLFDALDYEQTKRLVRRRFGAQMESGLAASLGLIGGKVAGSAR
jgi:hypothetical protein